jgi:hypothetical protein
MFPIPAVLVKCAMTVTELARILQNHIEHLRSLLTRAVAVGDVQQVSHLEVKIAETEATLAKLVAV